MKTYTEFTSLRPAERAKRDNFATLVSSVLPRPIAFVSTLSADGVANLAPFSFFNAVGNSPPAVMFCPCTRADGTDKHTLHNLRAVPECVVHVVPHDIRHEMNNASANWPADVSEIDAAEFTALPSDHVKPPRIAESPVAMEGRLMQIVDVGEGPGSGHMCIVEVLCFHIAREVLTDSGTVDVSKIDLVGRLGGAGYATIRDRFNLPKPEMR